MSLDAASSPYPSASLLGRAPRGGSSAAFRRFAELEAPLVRQVWKLAWPAIAHMLLVTFVFLAGRAMLGRYSSAALASMQISGSLTWAIYAIFTASSAGTLAVVARSVGAGDIDAASRAARASLALALCVGAAVVAPILLANGALLRFLFPNAGPAVLDDAGAYLHIVLPIMPLAFLEATAAAALQGAGDTRTPLYVAALGNVINVALSAALIFGRFGFPELGVRGAAVGAAATMAIEGVLLVAALLSKRSVLPIRRASRVCGATELSRVLRVSAPAFAERALNELGYLGFVALVALLGATAMAGNQALWSVEAICFLSAHGFGVAAGAIMAQKLGARRPSDAARGGLIAAGSAVALLSAFGMIILIAPGLLLRVFTSDPAILRVASGATLLAAASQPFMAFATVVGMGLRGAGDTKTVLAVSVVSALGLRLVLTWLFAIKLGFGLTGVWMASTCDWIVRSLLLGAAYVRGRWSEIVV